VLDRRTARPARQLEAPGTPLPLAELMCRYDAWVRAYNGERPHRSLAGQTPRQRWTADPTPLRLSLPRTLGGC
jgi:hypothetical protein